MIRETMPITSVEFVAKVRTLVSARCGSIASRLGERVDIGPMLTGKMLRTRLASRLAENRQMPADRAVLVRLAAAAEMIHTASLCHDDVIDDAHVRRSCPTLWRSAGRSAAILVGDLLFCDAMALVRDTAGGRHLPDVVAKLGEVVTAECEQELSLRGKPVDDPTCLRIARQKTGPLFALLSGACGGDDESLTAALTESGYRIGTAYQLADDLLDLVGAEAVAGKTLGGDARRSKHTLPVSPGQGRDAARRRVSQMCGSAVECLAHWPWARNALARYVKDDLLPVFRQIDDVLGACVRSAV